MLTVEVFCNIYLHFSPRRLNLSIKSEYRFHVILKLKNDRRIMGYDESEEDFKCQIIEITVQYRNQT